MWPQFRVFCTTWSTYYHVEHIFMFTGPHSKKVAFAVVAIEYFPRSLRAWFKSEALGTMGSCTRDGRHGLIARLWRTSIQPVGMLGISADVRAS
jgi:hypothetical protein